LNIKDEAARVFLQKKISVELQNSLSQAVQLPLFAALGSVLLWPEAVSLSKAMPKRHWPFPVMRF